jgi:serine/threonine protein kinase
MNQPDQSGPWQPELTQDPPAPSAGAGHPRQIGRYRVERLLGEGGFGLVYLAHDEQLQRPVAIKVPHRKVITRPEDAEPYLAEARIVAGLDHPNIVTVLDAGGDEEFPCYVVSKFIEGSTLTRKIAEGMLSVTECVELVATVAEALHHAHGKGVFHRDIKPGNILLHTSGKPYIADFGLALKEENIGTGPNYIGTPSYMSPEQARGEGHRVDGRSDIFSLGAVFYELLTNRRPFTGQSKTELLEQIARAEPRPPRQIDENIPRELERICLKALSRKASERYATARDMADDLRQFFEQPTEQLRKPACEPAPAAASATPSARFETPIPTPVSDQRPIRIVPKGLRSFDEQDADFFLELLPGPRDRDGLPDSIRFWKRLIETPDPEGTFSVGLIYGPSGCGKSSLVKAGLLPRLAKNVTAIYVEATGEETETRLLKALRKHLPDLPEDLGLKDSLAALRRDPEMARGRKILVLLDQFEQWLHARQEERSTELVQALRQCDGARVQCLVLVRDDFWLATTRLLSELEIDLLQGQNTAVVDLFDLDHARKVLSALGRAWHKLPENPGDTSKEQKEFLRQAVTGLARDGKVVCVRLALFAEMIKGKPWVPATLSALGGMEGVGVNFLEETFASAAANPRHRLHQNAARAVLKALLPRTGTDIKGTMRSHEELLAASDYAGRTKAFADLVRILDRETRLITPTDPEGTAEDDHSSSNFQAGRKYYQLTHDYLVHSLRDWLTRKQKETLRGRTEIRLAERAALWNSKVERRFLPSAVEWARIRLLTRPRDWTPDQRKMMRQADRYHLARMLALMGVLVLIALGAREYHGRLKARSLADSLLRRPGLTGVTPILDEIASYRRWSLPFLQQAFDEAQTQRDGEKLLKIRLALLRWDPAQAKDVYDSLLTTSAQDFTIIRDELAPYKDQFIEPLWAKLADPSEPEQRFRAAASLAAYAPEDPRWTDYGSFVVDRLLFEAGPAFNDWKRAFESAGRRLLPALTNALEMKAPTRRLVELYQSFAGEQKDAFAPLEEDFAQRGDHRLPARGKANIAATLMALGRGERVWPLLVHGEDPTLRSYLIERLRAPVDPKVLTNRLQHEPDPSIRRALILALGNFSYLEVPELEPILLDLYANDIDPGVHGASRWVFRRWQTEERFRSIENPQLITNGTTGHRWQDRLRAINEKLTTGRVEGNRRWYINKQHQTFAVVEAPGQLLVRWGGPARPPTYRLVVGSTEVTVEQFRAFRKDHFVDQAVATTPDSPVNKVTWYDVAAYCNWLSQQEGIRDDQWCYVPNKDGKLDFAPDYQRRTGYRLPTEDEWEFACRAGARTSWSFGEADEELVGHYAWWFGNARDGGLQRAFSVGLLKPNDFGLFDMHGNLFEWCQESATPQQNSFIDDLECATRGGSYYLSFHEVSSDRASRIVSGRKMSAGSLGFRLTRTLP